MDPYHLVRKCLRSDPGAQQLLYDLFCEQMMGICYRYTKSIPDAEDVLQEGFIKVYKNLNQYKADGDLGAWIRKIMVNTAINYLRKHNRYRKEMSFTELVMHPVTPEDPERILQARELAELIRELPTGYQTVFNLHAVEGYNHVEIAKILGISENTSRSQYMRARNVLIHRMEQLSRVAKNESYGEK